MSDQNCPRCDRALTDNTFICDTCATEAAHDLTRAADFLHHIDDKRARKGSRLWTGGGRASAEQPLPYDPRVRHVAEPARRDLTRWARLIIREHHCTNLPALADTDRIHRINRELTTWRQVYRDAAEIDETQRRTIRAIVIGLLDDLEHARNNANLTDLANLAGWIASHAEWIATRPYAHDIADRALTTREKLEHLFDNPPETYALGTCGNVHDTDDGRAICDHILAAPRELDHYTCPRCGHIHDVAARRKELLSRADDLSVTISDATRLLRVVGLDVTRQKVHRIVTEVGIQSTSIEATGGRPAQRYPLGAIRSAVELYNLSSNTRKTAGNVDKEDATLSA